MQTLAILVNQDCLFKNLQCLYEWLQSVSLTQDVFNLEIVSWSSYHSAKGRGSDVEVIITPLLTLLQDQIHSVSIIKHAMKKVKEITNFLNPSQTPAMIADQPLSVLA